MQKQTELPPTTTPLSRARDHATDNDRWATIVTPTRAPLTGQEVLATLIPKHARTWPAVLECIAQYDMDLAARKPPPSDVNK